MSMSNLILININIMDMKKNMLICIFISMLMDNKRGEIILKLKNNYQERNETIIKIRGSYQKGREVDRFGNVFEIVQGQPSEGLCKINKQTMNDYKKPPISQFFEIFMAKI